MFSTAITRKPGMNFAQGITTADLGQPSYPLILEQYATYVETLKRIGLSVIELDSLADYPDGYFVEDVAVVTPDVAVITNPGAASRNGEQRYIEPVLAEYREIAHIKSPGTVDGGDVLMVGNHFFIGISDRTNPLGAEQLGTILEMYNYTWTTASVDSGLHLKSSVNWVGENTLLIGANLANRHEFQGYEKIVIDRDEKYACNTLWINDILLTPMGFPKTKMQLAALGLSIIEMDASEMRKMDGGLTCLSIRF